MIESYHTCKQTIYEFVTYMRDVTHVNKPYRTPRDNSQAWMSHGTHNHMNESWHTQSYPIRWHTRRQGMAFRSHSYREFSRADASSECVMSCASMRHVTQHVNESWQTQSCHAPVENSWELMPHQNVSCHTHQCVMSHTLRVMAHTWTSHGIHNHITRLYIILGSWRLLRMCHVIHINASCRTYCKSWHTHEQVMAHTWTSHGTHMNLSWHSQSYHTPVDNYLDLTPHQNVSYNTHKWVMPHTLRVMAHTSSSHSTNNHVTHL